MKKSLFLAMAAVALLSGCSKDDGGITIDNGNGGNLDPDAVQIHLGTGLPTAIVTPNTRAVVESPKNWNGLKVGIYALAKNAQVNGVDLVWSNNDLGQRLLDNIEGTIAEGADPSINLNGNYYYPMSQGMNYTFYGYYPRVDAPVVTDDAVTASYALTGQDDILWGRAVASNIENAGTTYEGYNARYFRKNTGTATDPTIDFKHKLVRLDFKLKAGTEEGGDATAATNVKVKSINVVCQNKGVNLTIADKNKMNNTGTLEVGEITTTALTTEPAFIKDNPDAAYCLPLYSDYTSSMVNTVYTGKPTAESATTPMSIGLPIMLPTPALAIAGETAYYVKVELEASATQTLSTVIPVSTADGFLAGNKYDVTLVVNGLTGIKINATLTGWQNGSKPDDVEIN